MLWVAGIALLVILFIAVVTTNMPFLYIVVVRVRVSRLYFYV